MKNAKKLVRCPACGYEFDVCYSRTFACGSCPKAVQCSLVKCPKCGKEFKNPFVF